MTAPPTTAKVLVWAGVGSDRLGSGDVAVESLAPVSGET
jgi:hypothetical protein